MNSEFTQNQDDQTLVFWQYLEEIEAFEKDNPTLKIIDRLEARVLILNGVNLFLITHNGLKKVSSQSEIDNHKGFIAKRRGIN